MWSSPVCPQQHTLGGLRDCISPLSVRLPRKERDRTALCLQPGTGSSRLSKPSQRDTGSSGTVGCWGRSSPPDCSSQGLIGACRLAALQGCCATGTWVLPVPRAAGHGAGTAGPGHSAARGWLASRALLHGWLRLAENNSPYCKCPSQFIEHLWAVPRRLQGQ